MKKIIILVTCIFILTGCHSMQKLRVNYSPTGQDTGNYYQDKKAIGHNENVKYFVHNETSSSIKIPVKYTIKGDPIPEHLPEQLEVYRRSFDSMGECQGNCKLTSDNLTLNIYFKKRTDELCPQDEGGVVVMFLAPFLWPFIPNYISSCIGVDIASSQNFRLYNPFYGDKDLGITIKWKAQPDNLVLDCDSKSCVIRDTNGNIVNQVVITKWVNVDNKKIKQLLVEEKKKKEKEEEENKRWYKIQKKKCVPAIYILHEATYKHIDPFVQKQATDTYVDYNCDVIAREIFVGN